MKNITDEELKEIEARVERCKSQSYEFVDNIEPEKVLDLISELIIARGEIERLQDCDDHRRKNNRILVAKAKRLIEENAKFRYMLKKYCECYKYPDLSMTGKCDACKALEE